MLSKDTFVMQTFTEEGFKLDILNHKLRLHWVTFENLIADQIIQTELPILTKKVFIYIYIYLFIYIYIFIYIYQFLLQSWNKPVQNVMYM